MGGWVRELKGLSLKKNTFMNTDIGVALTRGKSRRAGRGGGGGGAGYKVTTGD